jgi:hypothetical protein
MVSAETVDRVASEMIAAIKAFLFMSKDLLKIVV